MGGAGGESRGAANLPSLPPGFEKATLPDNALHAMGFEYTRITAREVVGHLAITETYCQPFKMLNGSEHQRARDISLPEGRRRAALHQPRQAHLPRRPRRGAGQAHPGRPQHPGCMTLKKDTFAYYNYVYFDLKVHPQGSSAA